MSADLVGLASHRLPGARVPRVAPPWPAAREAVLGQGLLGLLADAVGAGAVALAPEHRDEVLATHETAMASCLRLEAACCDVLARLDAADVQAVAVGGIPVARLDYDDPSLRTFGDADVLVRADDHARAVGVLHAAGWRPTGGGRLVDGDGRCVEVLTEAQLCPGARVPVGELVARVRPLALGNRVVPVLEDDARLVVTALRCSAGSRVVLARDVAAAVLARRAPGDPVVRLAARWGATAPVARAIAHTWARFDLADVVGLSVWAARAAVEARPAGRLRRVPVARWSR